MSTAREAILERIRTALIDPSPGESREAATASPTVAHQHPDRVRPDLLDRFTRRVSDYGASVRVTEKSAIAPTVLGLCAERGATRLVCPVDLPAAWCPTGLQMVRDDGDLSFDDLDGVDGVLTGAALAAAETGTIALDHGPGQGRRALTLLPDFHICVLATSAIVPDVPELVEGLAAAVSEGRPLTLISGPSATSDIELSRVEGVHGPRHLAVVLIAQAADDAEPDHQERTHGS